MRIKSILAGAALGVGAFALQTTALAQSVNVLHTFAPTTNGTNLDGTLSYCTLALSGGTLFGTTYNGGANSNGTVFSLNADGSGFTNLHVFAARGGPLRINADGGWPVAGASFPAARSMAPPARSGHPAAAPSSP